MKIYSTTFLMTIDRQKIEKIAKDHPVILYDGVCALCNGFVKWVIRWDKNDRFRFAALQDVPSDLISIDVRDMKTVVLLLEGRTYIKSDVALRSVNIIGGLWKAASLFSIIPRVARDFVYDTVAKYRYRWFGQYEACPIPDPEVRHKFILPDFGN